jgi:ATP-dependent Clp protease ATP-binding subunit ClpA
MFERFGERARRAIDLAAEEARMLNHNYIGTEHILLGLIHEGQGVAATALESLGISLEMVRQQVEEIIGQGQRAPSGTLPMTPRAKKVLELSLREALQLGNNSIDTEHILLGLIREGEGVAAQVLVRLGAELDRARRRVVQLHRAAQGEDAPVGRSMLPRRPASRRDRRLLSDVLGRVESIDSQLSAFKWRIGAGPEAAELDEKIAAARHDKEAAARAEDYETAAALRDAERQLAAEKAARQEEWFAAHLDVRSLAKTLDQLTDEVRQLLLILSEHGAGLSDIEPHDGAA